MVKLNDKEQFYLCLQRSKYNVGLMFTCSLNFPMGITRKQNGLCHAIANCVHLTFNIPLLLRDYFSSACEHKLTFSRTDCLLKMKML